MIPSAHLLEAGYLQGVGKCHQCLAKGGVCQGPSITTSPITANINLGEAVFSIRKSQKLSIDGFQIVWKVPAEMALQPSGVVRHVFSTRQSQIALAISANFIEVKGRYLTWWWQKVRYLHTHTLCKCEVVNNNRDEFSCLVVRFVHRNNDFAFYISLQDASSGLKNNLYDKMKRSGPLSSRAIYTWGKSGRSIYCMYQAVLLMLQTAISV